MIKKSTLPEAGFTLIELSIVLVIIGLIVGGVLVGRDLIQAAEIRAQMSQLERYQVAVNTFKLKYNYLPGDIIASEVTKIGFTSIPTRNGALGGGDGNGYLQSVDDNGVYNSDSGTYGFDQCHENLYFWVDLSTNTNLIEGKFNTASNVSLDIATGTSDLYVPKGKTGKSYIMVYSTFDNYGAGSVDNSGGIARPGNYFGLVSFDSTITEGWVRGGPPLPVISAYNIDKKMDDGFPKTGIVRAFAPNSNDAADMGSNGGGVTYYSNAATSSSTTCFNTSTSAGVYSTDSNGGSGINCGISIEIK